MDPLSVTASAIALVQFGSGIAKTVKILQGFTNARVEFRDFLNELNTLQAVVHNIKTCLEDISQQKSRLTVAESTTLQSIIAELEGTTKELDDLSQKLLSGSKGPGENGIHRISKIQWQRLKGDIAKLRDKTRHARENLQLCFSALNVSQGVQSTTTVLEIKGIVEVMHAERVTLAHRTHTALAQTLTSTVEQSVESVVQRNNERLLDSIRQMIDMPPKQRRMESQLGRALTIGQPQAPSVGPNSSTICFQTTLRERCQRYCRCRCHKRSTIQNPRWLQSVVGAFSINYNSLPLFNRRPCDVPRCKSNSRSISLQYYFPRWMIARGIHIASSWSSLNGAGASLYLRIPVVINDHDIWTYIELDDADRVQKYMAKGELPLSMVDEDGESLILVSAFRFPLPKPIIIPFYGKKPNVGTNRAPYQEYPKPLSYLFKPYKPPLYRHFWAFIGSGQKYGRCITCHRMVYAGSFDLSDQYKASSEQANLVTRGNRRQFETPRGGRAEY